MLHLQAILRISDQGLELTQEFRDNVARLAGLVLVTAGTLALAVFGYFFYCYTLTGQRHFTTPAYFVIYYVVPLAMAGLLFASSRLAPARKVKLSLLLATFCASVFAVELLMEWRITSASTRPVMAVLAVSADTKKDAAALGKQWGVEIDPRTQDEVIASLRTNGVDPVPIVTPSEDLRHIEPDGSVTSVIRIDGQEVMPLGAISNRLTVLCNENGQWVHYQSDGHGFNNADEIWQQNRLEIAAIGNSFAQGWGVRPDENFVALIRQSHPATLNLGMGGDGPLMMLATFMEFVPHFRPPYVLWFFFEGYDIGELVNERKSSILNHYLTNGFTQSGLARQNDIDQAIIAELPRLKVLKQTNLARGRLRSPINAVINFARLPTLREQLGLIGGIPSDKAAAFQGTNLEIFRRLLFQVKAQVGEWGGHFVFVYLPNWSRYSGYPYREAMKKGEVLGLVRGLGIPAVDIDAAFKAQGDPLSLFAFRRPDHYNLIGQRVVAEAVLKDLFSSGAIPASASAASNK